MKKSLFILTTFLLTIVIACNNTEKKTEESLNTQTAKTDSLQDEVIEEHDIAMPKWMKIPDLQKETKRLLDSINKLPAKTREASAPYKAKLETLLNDLGNAYEGMEKWMNEFNLDSAKNNMEARIKYLEDEKLKVRKVKEDVLNSIAKADSVLKAKF